MFIFKFTKWFLVSIAVIILTACGSSSNNTDDNETEEVITPLSIKKTGQTTTYHSNDDGDLQKGVSTNYSRDNSKEVVLDKVTQLLWQDTPETVAAKQTWQDAKTYCLNLVLDGKGWRLPTRKELVGLYDYSKFDPSMDSTFEYATSSNYWSSTSSIENAQSAWTVEFLLAFQSTNPKDSESHVRCVRGNHNTTNTTFIKDPANADIVIDTMRDLAWQDSPATVQTTWREAVKYCDELTLGTYGDWRLPNSNELISLVNDLAYNPAINTAFTNTISDNYWSSTTSVNDTTRTWYVDFNDGRQTEDRKDGDGYVRCIRDR